MRRRIYRLLMNGEGWWRWLTEQTGTTVQKDIARRAGVDQSATSRWSRGQNLPRPDVAIAVARNIGRPPVEALIAAGHLRPEEAAEAVQIMPDLNRITNAQLIGLLGRRLGVHHAQEQESEQGEGSSEGGGEGDPGAPIATTGRPEVDDGLRRSVTKRSQPGRESKRTG